MDFSDFDSIDEIGEFILRFSNMFSKVARKILFWSIICLTITTISIYFGFTAKSAWLKLIAAPAIVSGIVYAIYCVIFLMVTQLPKLITANLDFITKAIEDDIPDVLQLFQNKNMKGTRKILMTGGVVIKVLYEAIDDLTDSGRIISSTIFMANPIFWILYFLSIMACLVLSFIIWMPKIIAFLF